MQNPEAANHRKGKGRQVSFIIENKRLPTYTDWMKHCVDSPQGKEIYSHRMSVVEPVFGNIGTPERLNRFSLRGRKKVRASGSYTAWCTIFRNWGITGSWRRDTRIRRPKLWPPGCQQ